MSPTVTDRAPLTPRNSQEEAEVDRLGPERRGGGRALAHRSQGDHVPHHAEAGGGSRADAVPPGAPRPGVGERPAARFRPREAEGGRSNRRARRHPFGCELRSGLCQIFLLALTGESVVVPGWEARFST